MNNLTRFINHTAVGLVLLISTDVFGQLKVVGDVPEAARSSPPEGKFLDIGKYVTKKPAASNKTVSSKKSAPTQKSKLKLDPNMYRDEGLADVVNGVVAIELQEFSEMVKRWEERTKQIELGLIPGRESGRREHWERLRQQMFIFGGNDPSKLTREEQREVIAKRAKQVADGELTFRNLDTSTLKIGDVGNIGYPSYVPISAQDSEEISCTRILSGPWGTGHFGTRRDPKVSNPQFKGHGLLGPFLFLGVKCQPRYETDKEIEVGRRIRFNEPLVVSGQFFDRETGETGLILESFPQCVAHYREKRKAN